MGKKVLAIAFIFILVAVAWMVLGGSVSHRTAVADAHLSDEVEGLWGSPHEQMTPQLTFTWKEKRASREITSPETAEARVVEHEVTVVEERPVNLDSSRIDVDLQLEQRKKGLLWYSMYTVDFAGRYTYEHRDAREGQLVITYRFPSPQATYDEFRFTVDGIEADIVPGSANGQQVIRHTVPVSRGSRVPFDIAYRSRGLDSWRYHFGSEVNRVKDFRLTMTTDFDDVDFPPATISPTTEERTTQGWRMTWSSQNSISRLQIGMVMPHKLNPGPLAARISVFAPVCLGFFFVWIFVITLFRGIDLHPVNYLFLGAAFFAFHLLFSYTVDHLPVLPAFLLASAVSIFLVISYLRLVVGLRFAAVEAGLSQLVYLVLFSYAHFFEGLTGLMVTVGSILTLFALMQLTARVEWSEVFAARAGRGPSEPGAIRQRVLDSVRLDD